MKHWLLGFVFLLIAIISGMEAYKEFLAQDKNWLNISLLMILCLAGFIFYFRERKKRNTYFKKRMDKDN